MGIEILESDAQIEKLIIQELKNHFKEVLLDSKNIIEERFKIVIIEAIKKEPEYYALLNGRLLAEFGLTDVVNKLDIIINTVVQNIEIEIKDTKLSLFAVSSNFDELLQLSEAQQLTNKGQSLDWLQWLLIYGDKTIIRDYEVEFNPTVKSRSGLAIMVKSKRAKWHVPSEYAGTRTNNWITRAVDNIQDNKIERIIQTEITNKW